MKLRFEADGASMSRFNCQTTTTDIGEMPKFTVSGRFAFFADLLLCKNRSRCKFIEKHSASGGILHSKSIARISVPVLFSTLITACSFGFSLPADEPLSLTVFRQGHLIEQQRIGQNDPVRVAVNRWLAANPSGWSYGFRTRDPRLYLSGRTFHINVSENEVAVKYCHGFFSCHFWVKSDNRLFAEVQSKLGRPGESPAHRKHSDPA